MPKSIDNVAIALVSFGYKPKRKGTKMNMVIGTGAQIVNAAYVAKFAASNAKAVDARIATRSISVAEVRDFQMEMCTVM